MRICLVYQGEFPPAERIEKMAKTLTAIGHEVFLLCNDYGKFAAREERCGDVHVIRVGPPVRSRKVNKVLKFPLFANPVWIAALVSAVRRYRIEAIQVIDIPLSVAAWGVARLFGIPVVMDMWENYPEALRGWAERDWKVRLFKNPNVARLVELWINRRMDHIFTVVEEQKERLIDEGVQPDRITVVTNAVDLDMLTASEVRHDTPLDNEPGAFKLLYVGCLTVERGLDDIIRALPRLRSRIPAIRLYLAGAGSYEPQLRALVERENVGDLVTFIGWVPFGDIQSYILKSDLCIVPHVYNTFINTTMPNKLFQYMALRKPVLVSNAKPLARVVNECDCGFVFRSGDPMDAAAAIENSYKVRDNRDIGERGRRCIEAKYTWNHVAAGIERVYARLPVARRTYVAEPESRI
jgi:glycosyltransferase involved in cell wall biosynthesis